MDRECNKIQNPDNFFIELSRRPDKKAYFYVFDNTSDQIDGFLCKYFDAGQCAAWQYQLCAVRYLRRHSGDERDRRVYDWQAGKLFGI